MHKVRTILMYIIKLTKKLIVFQQVYFCARLINLQCFHHRTTSQIQKSVSGFKQCNRETESVIKHGNMAYDGKKRSMFVHGVRKMEGLTLKLVN